MRTYPLRPASSPDEENPYWISFSDIMAGLLILFMLASLAFMLELKETQQRFDRDWSEFESAAQVRARMLREIQVALKDEGIIVEIVDNDSIIRIPEGLLFERGKWELPDDAHERCLVIGNVLLSVVSRNSRHKKYLDTIFIEGHTDSDQFRNDRHANWTLSALRAITIWKSWLDSDFGSTLAGLRNRNGRSLFSVSGYADTRPVREELKDDDKLRNRRIDLRFTIRTPAVDDFNRLQRILQDQSGRQSNDPD